MTVQWKLAVVTVNIVIFTHISIISHRLPSNNAKFTTWFCINTWYTKYLSIFHNFRKEILH